MRMEKSLWKTLEPGPNPPEEVNALIEIPKGSRNKYEMDHETGVVFLDRVLHTAFVFPFDYGIIPQTWYLDGDPMDIMVLTQAPTFPGCVVPSRPIGLMKMKDEAGEDYKVLAVPVKDPVFENIRGLKDVSEGLLEQIKHFFEHYKELERGKWTRVEGWEDADSAKKAINESIERYRQRFLEKAGRAKA